MKTTVSILILILLSGCATYRIDSGPSPAFERLLAERQAEGKDELEIEIKKKNDFPGGVHCFEPMLYVLTLGIIPTHCVNEYEATIKIPEITESNENTKDYKFTSMQGWVALFLTPLPNWRYGFGSEEEKLIKETIRSEGK